MLRDDLGEPVRPPRPVRRVVSLVPSLTEAVAATAPGLLVGATDWCTHPAGLDVARVRGTKNPDVANVVALRPDIVLANFEENRRADVDALRAAGVAVWVTAVRALPEAFASLSRTLAVIGAPAEPDWLAAARAAWAGVLERPPRPQRRAVVPVWRRPWMVLGRDTFAGDVLARLGVANAFAGAEGRYQRVGAAELVGGGADLAVLPDEPYPFAADDGPEAFGGIPVALVSGRHLEWYGPSLAAAREVLTAQLAAARVYPAPGRPP